MFGNSRRSQNASLLGRGAPKNEVPASVRADFVRKVYGILLCQVLCTTAIAAVCTLSEVVRGAIIGMAVHSPTLLQFLLFVPSVASLITLGCVKNKYPLNYGCLSVFTVSMSMDVGLVCAIYYEMGLGNVILQACALTALIFGSLTLYVRTTKRDFSYLRAYLSCGLCCLIACSFLMFFFPSLNRGTFGLVHAFCGAMIFAGYIVFDTWRLEQVLGVDDYIVAAIELYLDIVNLFLYILKILAKMSKRD